MLPFRTNMFISTPKFQAKRGPSVKSDHQRARSPPTLGTYPRSTQPLQLDRREKLGSNLSSRARRYLPPTPRVPRPGQLRQRMPSCRRIDAHFGSCWVVPCLSEGRRQQKSRNPNSYRVTEQPSYGSTLLADRGRRGGRGFSVTQRQCRPSQWLGLKHRDSGGPWVRWWRCCVCLFWVIQPRLQRNRRKGNPT